MRSFPPLLVAAALWACTGEPLEKSPDLAAAEAAAAEDPRILLAPPEAANYAPPDWPKRPGDLVTWRELRGLEDRFEDHWGLGTIWVASESGLPGALPFVAWFAHDPEVSRERSMSTHVYIGHMPTKAPLGGDFYDDFFERDMPAALRGVADVARINRTVLHTFPFGDFADSEGTGRDVGRVARYAKLRQLKEEARARYYGADASW